MIRLGRSHFIECANLSRFIYILAIVKLVVSTEYGIPIEIKLWDSKRTPLAHMVDVTNEFGIKVLAEHNFLNDNNIAFSPYGLMGILVALYEGVEGESSYQIQRSMQLPWNRNVMRIGFRDIHRTLKTYFIPEEGFLAGLALNNENVTFNESYKKILRFYGFDLDMETSTTSPVQATNSTQPSSGVDITSASSISGSAETTTEGVTSREDPSTVKTTEGIKVETTLKPNAETVTILMDSEQNFENTTTTVTTVTTPPVSSTNSPVSSTDSSISSINLPITLTDSPVISTVPPVSLPGLLVSLTDSSVISTVPPLNLTDLLENLTDPSVISTVSPVSSTNLPVRSTNSSVISSVPPVSSTDLPVSSTDSLVSSTDSSVILTRPSVSLADLLVSSTDLPVSLTDSYVSSTDSPENSTDPSVISTVLPVSSTDLPVSSTDSPVSSTDSSVMSTAPLLNWTDLPVNSTDSSEVSTVLPSSSINLPVSLIDLPVISTVPSISLTVSPLNSTDLPVSSTDSPVTSTDLPENSTDPSVISTVPSVSSTDLPVSSTDSPVSSTNSSVISTVPPVSLTDLPVSSTLDSSVSSTDSAVISTVPLVSSTDSAVISIVPPVSSTDLPIGSTDPPINSTDPTSTFDESIVDQKENTQITEVVMTSSITESISTASTEIKESLVSLQTTSNQVSNESVTATSGSTVGNETEISTAQIIMTTTETTVLSTNSDNSITTQSNKSEVSSTSTAEMITEQTSTTLTTDASKVETTMGTTSSIENLQRRKKSVEFLFTSPPYADDYLVYRSFDVGYEVPEQHVDDDTMFLVNGLRNIQVTYMQYDSMLDYAYLPHLEASALRLPLDSERYYLLVVLPLRRGSGELSRLLGRMARESDLSDVYAALHPRRVKAVVPSFTVKGHISLTTDLQKLGIRDVFEPRQHDFSPMTSQPGVYVRSIEQAVSVAIRKYQPDDVKNRYLNSQNPVVFSATHPFLYFVMDSNIHVALMAGKMVDPLNTRVL